ncbi:hypothetical protein CKM354_000510400 [Cercospora kikuchii]|uniref:Uncharacterized protein n=1 Tax=Cercospora kikuchii TaxID=84275 RepID=A0A9P3CH18_9PEZI|nr:uncharacterized protein CKM354_000510400 [Cercospora kikuchii]GIZ41811.1 hypothetical protein CKM354_000510400 [Cercospora kikuchii]
MNSTSVQPNGLAAASIPGPTIAPSNLSLTSVMADQYIGLRHFSTCEEARADRDSRVVCAPETDDLDAVKNNESFWLNKILESFVRVLSHDPEKPDCIKQSESDWREDVQIFKNEIYSKIIKSDLISHQAEKTGRLLLQEVFWLHEYGWHVDLWKPDKFRKVMDQYHEIKCTDRLNAICDVLSTCAPLVCDVLDGKNLERFVGSPGIMVVEKHGFRQSNLRRSKTKEQKAAKKRAAETTEKPTKKRKNAAQPSPLAVANPAESHSTPTMSPMARGHHAPSLLPKNHPCTPALPSFTQSLPQQTYNNFATGSFNVFQGNAGNGQNYGANLTRHDSAVDWSQGGYFGTGNEGNTDGFSFSMPSSQSQYATGLMPAFQPSYGWGSTTYSGENGNIDWNEPTDQYE